MTPETFEELKPALLNAFEAAALAAMVEMGEDLKGVAWFSVVAEDYCAATSKAA